MMDVQNTTTRCIEMCDSVLADIEGPGSLEKAIVNTHAFIHSYKTKYPH